MTLTEAIDVFACGFATTHSRTHPYEVVRHGPLWVLRDLPRKRGPYRVVEILASGISPEEAHRLVQEVRPERLFLCSIEPMGANFDGIKSGYKALGYRHLRREPFFVQPLTSEISCPDPSTYQRVRSDEQAAAVAVAAGQKQIPPEHLLKDDAPARLYAAFRNGEAVGWVTSIRCGESAWVSSMYVREQYRRQGHASALLRTMMSDDYRLGISHSVLLASSLGSKLYPTVGYEQIGLLQSFMPRRAASG